MSDDVKPSSPEKSSKDDRNSGSSSPSAAEKSGRTGGGAGRKAKFIEGSILKHVVTMTAAGSVGLLAVFLVDFANLFYISLLGQTELAAAIGYASTIMFFNTSASVGLMIAGSAIVARALGAGDKELARRRASSALAAVILAMVIIVACVFPFIGTVLELIGARGETHTVAVGFLQIVVPSLPFLGIAMMLGGLLRASGDAKRSMYVTLSGGLASAILDPIFIFGFDLGVTGAAIASVLARIVMIMVGLHSVVRVHGLLGKVTPATIWEDWKPLFGIAVPAVLTNVATPVGNAYVTYAIAPFGDDAVAGWAIVGRMIPLSYTALFAISGSVGPIFGQNLGAGLTDRVRETLRESMKFILAYSLFVWAILFVAQDWIVLMFGASGETANFVRYFCTWIAGSGIFMGFLFVANAAFNNLGYPTYSTAFNWGKATLGTIPPVMLGAYWFGAEGALAGQAIGAIVFGVAAVVTCFRVINKAHKPEPGDKDEPPLARPALSPFSSGKGNM
ncbi:MAG: MATE family efflux transporter [Cohaesibacter sp.]|jgi:putative MATE family efflux protein|nr:MATE family efflux transporter [Cohaesibacter sp.]